MLAQEGFGHCADHQLRQVRRLEEKPVPVGRGQLPPGVAEHRVRGGTMSSTHSLVSRLPGKSGPSRCAQPAPPRSWPSHSKALVPERLHQQAECRAPWCAYRSRRAACPSRRSRAGRGAHDREPVEQPGRDLAPHLPGLWIAVQHHHRRASASEPCVDADAVGTDRALLHRAHVVVCGHQSGAVHAAMRSVECTLGAAISRRRVTANI